jgi:hypothetical protein
MKSKLMEYRNNEVLGLLIWKGKEFRAELLLGREP